MIEEGPAAMIPNITFPAALAALLLLASCGTQSAKKSQATDQANDGVATLAENPVDAKLLLAAAEEFETIAETSFSADVAAREKMIANAAKAVAEVTGSASPKLRARLQTGVADILKAHRTNEPADLAIASIEVYRDLISAVPGQRKIPVHVGLLEYAGLRFDADAQAKPPRFADMEKTAAFAEQQWAEIKLRKEIDILADGFEASLSEMGLAARSRDVARARAAAKVELDMVDELEAAFGR